ncbi:hypothetical protein EG341_00850 [Chryseobacterium lactis]|uniref:Lipoprotein n=1 Tax=Chryseobacterium lactis TaxID=1241981 RepID=A0ABM7AXQ2_CHRLC|nr:hypothetical protein [Chryseobacterium lactis]AZA82215.1 hypothetical protein EG342_09995 [Chryseobacterium lactis]AZB02596.1 hypothetical protein EG341_00850 [Chryseobacterium lactis]
MKKVIILIPLCFLGCSKDDDSACFQTWNVTEYCTRSTGCSIVGCGESPKTLESRFKCDEVQGVKNGDVINYKTVECAKFYRKYNFKVN